MKQCMDYENLHNRLSRIIGQIQAIDKMIDKIYLARIFCHRLTRQNPHCIKPDRLCLRDI